MPLIEHRPIRRIRDDCAWLLQHRWDITSQIGQDGILAKVFETIGAGGRFCVEFGAWDGRWLSNTFNLIANEGWSGLLIEGDAEKAALIAKTHPYPRVQHLCGLVGWDGPHALERILDGFAAPREIDLISIDVDGNDWHIWRSIKHYRPRVILIEFNPTVPNDIFFVQDPDPTLNQGASLLALVELGREKGYSLVCADRWDAFFVRDDLFQSFRIADNSIDVMYTPEFETKIFQSYDSTIYTAGNRRLIWSGIEFDADQLQVLSKDKRVMNV